VTASYPAAIIADGFPTGLVCQDTLTGLAPGEHVVTIELPGFQGSPNEIPVTIVPSEIVEAKFALVVPKLVVCEDFSNYACIPCPPADAALEQAMDEVGWDHVMSVNPHVNFPGREIRSSRSIRTRTTQLERHLIRAHVERARIGIAVESLTASSSIKSFQPFIRVLSGA